ncbi:glutathione S-transferase [Rhodocollybia butyracea]|uniref:glutathione transferase n=1 Tax=Rhodocollybia butyracea TaxID=206335 RepID=A0A9P5P8A0_9AGAR|nr:glutathione S-transferase [Rhodocollybia butyracea]
MTLTLYGAYMCPSTARIQVVLHEKSIPYKLVNTDEESFRHPIPEASSLFGNCIPFIIDKGFILHESRAICRYLATQYADQGTKLIPDVYSIKCCALFEQAVLCEALNFDPYASKAGYENVIKRSKGLLPDEAIFEASIAGLSSKLDAYESILGEQRYLAGNALTLADLYHIPWGTLLTRGGSDIMTRKGPNITRWWNEISTRDSSKGTVLN